MTNYNYPKTWSVTKGIGRLLVGGLVYLPSVGLYSLTPEQIPELWILAIIASLLPATLAGYLMFGFSDEFSLKVKLYDAKNVEYLVQNDV